MALTLKTFKGGNVTPQDDAIIHQTILPGAGVFKGCEVAIARSNVLHISQGFGMIAGRFFEMYETEVSVQLEELSGTKNGRLYLHMDLSNTDEPLQVLTEVADELSALALDNNVNYNNTTYDMELATFKVTSTEVTNLKNTTTAIQPIGGGGGGAAGVMREANYQVGDTTSAAAAPGWCTLYCTQAGKTAKTEPEGYAQITKVGDQVLDGTAMFEARNTIGELSQAQTAIMALGTRIDDTVEYVNEQLSDTGNLVQKIMKTTDYNRLSTKDPNTIYYLYDDNTTKEIKHIYLGAKVMVDTSVSVNYKIDTNNTVTKTVSTQADALLTAPLATKAGFTFLGWKLNDTPDGEVLSEYVITGNSTVSLYAVFKKDIEIAMDPLDSDVPDGVEEPAQETTLYYNNGKMLTDEITIPECPYTTEGKMFYAWTINPSEDGTYIPGEKYKMTDECTLYPAFLEPEMEFPLGTSYQRFLIPASGLYEFQLWGAAGGDAEYTPSGGTKLVAKGGKGGYVKVYKMLKKGEYIYLTIGQKPTAGQYYGDAIGTYGRSYNSNSGASGGGATAIGRGDYYNPNNTAHSTSYSQNSLYYNRDKCIAVAGGGGGGGIEGNTADGIHAGGYAGGEKGQNGSNGALGGAQKSQSYNEYDGFGGYYLSTSGNSTYSGGGCGWFAGQYGTSGKSGAGGSSYIMNSPTFTFRGVRYKAVNTADNNDGDGHIHMRFVLPCKVEVAS